LINTPSDASRYVAERISGARFVELPTGDITFWGGDFEDLTIALARRREHPVAVENQLRSPAFSILSISSWAEPSPRSRSHSLAARKPRLNRSAMSAP
jgi:hypothetical protein